MFLLIPIRTDSPVRRHPYVNHVLIGANVVMFLIESAGRRLSGDQGLAEWLAHWPLYIGDAARWYQYVSYQFLHADPWHIFGNMLFLWVFGNSVNSKMGNPGYLAFYLLSGVVAGMGWAMVTDHDAALIGASGAIAGVTTAYFVLFPRSEVVVFYWIFLYLGTMHIQAMLLIGLKVIAWDNLLAPALLDPQGVDSVAYSAHVAGYVFGFTVSTLLLAVRLLPRDHFDILALMKRFRQRQQFKMALADPNKRAQAIYGRAAQPVSAVTGRPVEPLPPEQVDEIYRLRTEIANLLAQERYEEATETYEQLVARDPSQTLPRRHMLVVANQLMTAQRHAQAAAAYEKFLRAYPTDGDAAQIKLVLGILYAKYLRQYEAAQRYLRESASRLTNEDQLDQARHWLDIVAGASGGGSPAVSS